VLAIGGFIFVIIASIVSYGFMETYLVLGVLFFAAILFLWLVKYFSQKALVPSRDIYVISDWSMKTLIAAGIPEDITLCLKGLRKHGRQRPKELRMKIDAKSSDNWLEKLKAELGETRVSEFEAALLKYTRRKDSE
jgi:hypothetical protein